MSASSVRQVIVSKERTAQQENSAKTTPAPVVLRITSVPLVKSATRAHPSVAQAAAEISNVKQIRSAIQKQPSARSVQRQLIVRVERSVATRHASTASKTANVSKAKSATLRPNDAAQVVVKTLSVRQDNTVKAKPSCVVPASTTHTAKTARSAANLRVSTAKMTSSAMQPIKSVMQTTHCAVQVVAKTVSVNKAKSATPTPHAAVQVVAKTQTARPQNFASGHFVKQAIVARLQNAVMVRSASAMSAPPVAKTHSAPQGTSANKTDANQAVVKIGTVRPDKSAILATYNVKVA